MSLLEELKEKLQTVCAEQDEQLAKIRVHEAFLGAAMQDIRDLSRAIAALEPSAVEGSSVAAYFDARRAEALLDPQPEAASPEFASEQGEPIEEMIATSDAVCEELSEAYTPLQIPEGFTPWSGGECPIPNPAQYAVIHRDGMVVNNDHFCKPYDDAFWSHIGSDTDIVGYRIISSREVDTFPSAERIEVASEPLATTEQTLITDDIPSIPREEIPIGSAVETYTDSGIETVKISGTTYVVDDEPERQAETQPEAAYAPVNEDECLMWANGFEADAKSKAELEQDKRPFWMFGKKELA